MEALSQDEFLECEVIMKSVRASQWGHGTKELDESDQRESREDDPAIEKILARGSQGRAKLCPDWFVRPKSSDREEHHDHETTGADVWTEFDEEEKDLRGQKAESDGQEKMLKLGSQLKSEPAENEIPGAGKG
jgi:hypothetical protein